ncbi:MAG: DsbC family protein [Gammaproteobacteria bacterium]
MRKLLAIMFFGLFVLDAAAADANLQKQLETKLRTVIPDASITRVTPGPIPGLYEVMLGASVLYMSGDGRYVFRGDIFDLKSKDNLTGQVREQARVAAFRAQDAFSIEFAPTGPVEHTLYVFTDIDCGYCRKMHQEVGKLNAAGIAVRYLAFPRTGLDGESFKKAVSVWCADDQKAALTAAKLGQGLAARTCKNPVATQYELGQSVGVHGTPAVFTADGREIGGYIPAGELIKMFELGEI